MPLAVAVAAAEATGMAASQLPLKHPSTNPKPKHELTNCVPAVNLA